MKQPLSIALAIILSGSLSVSAADNNHQSYALDKLANAQAQLDRLKSQETAIKDLIKAVKKDLKAAKIRAKAERVQLEADTLRQDAIVSVEQSGVAVDLPNLMTAKGVQAGLKEYEAEKDEVEMMFKDNNASTKSVYFPGGSQGKKIEPSNKVNSEIPDYIK